MSKVRGPMQTMKGASITWFSVACSALLVGLAEGQGKNTNIVEVAAGAGTFSTLVTAIGRAGLLETLSGPGPFTLFAPTDDAFDALLQWLRLTAEDLLAREDLAEILNLHLVAGRLTSGDVVAASEVQTLEDARLEVTSVRGTVKIGIATVVTPDVEASNGVIHVIDAVLLPPTRLHLGGGSKGWDKQSWRVQVDGVMGGLSTGDVRFTDEGAMIFAGNINLDGGGFSSVLKRFGGLVDLHSYAGLLVRIDAAPFTAGHAPLGIHLQLGDATSKYSFAAAIAVPFSQILGERASIFLPFDAFTHASWMGRKCLSCQLNTRSINELHVYVLFQAGPFEVRLRSISAVRRAMDAPLPSVPVVALDSKEAIITLIRSTISSGASLYDNGYKALCAAIYASSARTILLALGPSAPTKALACAGLARASTCTEEEKSWALRRTLDAILADLEGNTRRHKNAYPHHTQGSWLPSVGSTNCSFSSTSSMTGGGSLGSFMGPFKHMGISAWNDLEASHVHSPHECGRKCLADSRCRSFDYGARRHVTGECWLSTADRELAGSAYTHWQDYDYYELDPQLIACHEPMNTQTIRNDSSEWRRRRRGKSGGISDIVWVLFGVAVVASICFGVCAVILCMRMRSRKQSIEVDISTQPPTPQHGDLESSKQIVVIGQPIVQNEPVKQTVDVRKVVPIG